MATRKALTKKVRFEVFKRDSFKCQYCGKSAPDVILHVDHIKPVASGGKNEMTNLITACFDCNMGKKDVPLDDNSALEKQKRQLEEMNERRTQLEMMLKWRESMENLEDMKLKAIKDHWRKIVKNQYFVNPNGEKQLLKMLKKYDLNFILECFDTSANQYLRIDKQGQFIKETVEKAFNYAEKIAANIKRLEQKPYLNELYYMKGILKNRLSYWREWEVIPKLERAYHNGASLTWLKELCCEAYNWSYFCNSLDQFKEGEHG